MFMMVSDDLNDFLSDKELQREYEYVMAVYDLAGFVVEYGADKVMNDILNCAASLKQPTNIGD